MKKSVAYLVLAAVSTPALAADTTAPVVEKLLSCTDVRDSRERLACFDREIAPLAKAKTALTPAPVVRSSAPTPVAPPSPAPAPAPAAPATSPPPPASFGSEQLASKDRPPAKEEDQILHARIVSLRKVNVGAYLVTLDNGQAWRHEDEVQGSYLREGEAVTITKATLSTYRLTRDAGNAKNWIRITRVR
jgi:hypothetical protein